MKTEHGQTGWRPAVGVPDGWIAADKIPSSGQARRWRSVYQPRGGEALVNIARRADPSPDSEQLGLAMDALATVLERDESTFPATMRQTMAASRQLCELAIFHPLVGAVLLTPGVVGVWGSAAEPQRTDTLRREVLCRVAAGHDLAPDSLCSAVGAPFTLRQKCLPLRILLAATDALEREPKLRHLYSSGALPTSVPEAWEALALVELVSDHTASDDLLRWIASNWPALHKLASEKRRAKALQGDVEQVPNIQSLVVLAERSRTPDSGLDEKDRWHARLSPDEAAKRVRRFANREAKETRRREQATKWAPNGQAAALMDSVPQHSELSDGNRVRLLRMPEAIFEHGRALRQCIRHEQRGYIQAAMRGEILLFAVDDPQGVPIATAELHPEAGQLFLSEVRGYKNKEETKSQGRSLGEWTAHLNAGRLPSPRGRWEVAQEREPKHSLKVVDS